MFLIYILTFKCFKCLFIYLSELKTLSLLYIITNLHHYLHLCFYIKIFSTLYFFNIITQNQIIFMSLDFVNKV